MGIQLPRAGPATRILLVTRNRFAGEPFEDGDEAIARALEDVSIPALMCVARAHER